LYPWWPISRRACWWQLPLHLDTLPGAPTAQALHDSLHAHYAGSPWVRVEPPTEDLKLDAVALAHTNLMELRVFSNPNAGHALLVARLDNLGKGASGAAVQNLQLMLGLKQAAAPAEHLKLEQWPMADVA
jgi:N-acetyl-gamma-glutamyl-phosphate reductase